MNLMFFCPLWGCEGSPFDDFTKKVSQAGYDGVEMSLPFDQGERKVIAQCLEKYGLTLIGQHYQTHHPDFTAHKAEYQKHLLNLADADPLFINSHTGRDYFTFDQNAELIDLARDISNRTGVKIIHETHRGRFSFAAHITMEYLKKIPDLRLGLDISHWFAVAESMLDDQPEAVEMALQRTDHIHARIGFEEGPQIPDPRDIFWREVIDKHLQKWDRVVESAKARGQKTLTITCEFGPLPYMPRMPLTGLPISDQWQINVFMKDMLTKRFKQS